MPASTTMEWRFYLQLFTFTAGALLYLFLAVLLGALRKVRLPESLLFFGWVALFLFYAGGLLGMNVAIEYHTPPPGTLLFAFLLAVVGLAAAPPLLVHAQAEFLARLRGSRPGWAGTALTLAYLPALYLLIVFFPVLFRQGLFEALDAVATPAWRMGYAVWLALAFVASAALEWKLAQRQSVVANARVGRILAVLFFLGGALSAAAAWRGTIGTTDELLQTLIAALLFVPVAAGALLIYVLIRQSLMGTGLQRSLVYSVALAFVALLYLKLVLRLSEWLVPLGIPFEATVSILLFVFVLFIQPLQQRVARVFERAFRRQAETLQHLIAEIQQAARSGNLEELLRFAEKRIAGTLELNAVRIRLSGGGEPSSAAGQVARFALHKGEEKIGELTAHYYGQALSGETHAALEYLAGQLPAAVDLCRLLDEKLRLERELSERERMAVLGQMAASISHNLKNPLSSMKTLLQVQLENPALPGDAKRDCTMAVAEIDRLAAKLAQLLQFAKPAVRATGADESTDAARAAEQAVALLRYDAERRGVKLTYAKPAEAVRVAAAEQPLNDVLTNLVVNAIEAVPTGGAVRVEVELRDSQACICVTDDGPGISAEARERLFQPFYTTKPKGTGLGLAIVARRLEEIGGAVSLESPVANGRGTRFTVTLPLK